jgi:hypothetical protein
VFLNAFSPHVMHVPIVQIVDMTVMFDARVTTTRAMFVTMIRVKRNSHGSASLMDGFRYFLTP